MIRKKSVYLKMTKIDEVRKIAKTYFKKPVSGHDWFHIERVYQTAIEIGKVEEANMSILKPAALLHDIAKKKEDMGKTKCHAQEGAKMAKKILNDLGYPKEKIKQIAYAIKVHRYKRQIKPKTLEAQILQDADRIDVLGAIGVGRIFSYGGEHKRPMHNPKIPPQSYYDSNSATTVNHFFEKICKLKPDTFNTKTGRQIANERYKYSRNFVKRFLLEWKGKL